MISFMREQEHIAYTTEFGVAIKSPQLPLWILLHEKKNTEQQNLKQKQSENIQLFFNTFLQKYPQCLIGLVAEEKTALICAKLYNKPFNKRDMAAYYLKEKIASYTMKEMGDKNIHPLTQTQDIKLVQKWIHNFYIETLNVAPPSFQKQQQESKKKDKPKNLPNTQIYLLKDEKKNETVAMGMLSDVVDNICRINLIYTPPHLRGRGYGKQMVCGLVSIAQNKGIYPMLYTTLDNAIANKLYQSLGFIKAGQLTEILFSTHHP